MTAFNRAVANRFDEVALRYLVTVCIAPSPSGCADLLLEQALAAHAWPVAAATGSSSAIGRFGLPPRADVLSLSGSSHRTWECGSGVDTPMLRR